MSDVARIAAFVRRDWLVTLSYRTAFVGDTLQLAAGLLLFVLLAGIVDPSRMPTYDGTRAGYLEFAAIGTALSLATSLLIIRVGTAIRNEQMIGTLEALMLTPTRMRTLQAGTVALDALLVPLRLGVFLVGVWVVLGLDLHVSGLAPAAVVLAAYLPFAWGLGLISAGAVIAFRRGIGVVALAANGLGLVSGAYVPASAIPHWVVSLTSWNPMASSLQALREALIGGAGWRALDAHVLALVPFSAAALVAGGLAFRAAIAHERRRGTLGLY